MATNKKNYLSRLMRLSWDIQKKKRSTRAKALQAAWAIISNEDLTVSYLVKRLNHHRPLSPHIVGQFSLFNQQPKAFA